MARSYTAIIVLLAAALAALSACTGDDTTDDPAASADEVLRQASERFREVDTAHFALQIEGEVALDNGGLILLRSAEGEIERPNSAEAKADISFGGTNLSMTMIAIGDRQYITNFVTGRWEPAPEGLGYNPAILFDEDDGISGVLRDVQNAEIVETATVRGQESYHIRGLVSRETVRPMTGGAFTSEQIELDLWIAREGYDVLRVVLRDQPGGGEAEAATWTLEISNQNQPVSIEEPSV